MNFNDVISKMINSLSLMLGFKATWKSEAIYTQFVLSVSSFHPETTILVN